MLLSEKDKRVENEKNIVKRRSFTTETLLITKGQEHKNIVDKQEFNI